MKISKIIFAVVCIVGLTQLVWSQDEAMGARERGIPGYLNPKTGTFSTRAQSESSEALPNVAATYYYGTITITMIVSVASSFPSGTVFRCTGSANTSDSGGGEFYEDASVTAPAPSGGKTTCTVTMNYYWQLSTPSSDYIGLSFEVDAFNTVTVGSQTEVDKLRSASRTPPSILGVPTTNGTVTAVTYYTRL